MSIQNGTNGEIENLAAPPAATLAQLTTNPFTPVANQGGVPADTVDGSYDKEVKLGNKTFKDHYKSNNKSILGGGLAIFTATMLATIVTNAKDLFHGNMAILGVLLACITLAAAIGAVMTLLNARERSKKNKETNLGVESQFKANSNVRDQVIKSDMNVKISDKKEQENAHTFSNSAKSRIIAEAAADQYSQYKISSLKTQENLLEAVKNFESKKAGSNIISLDHIAKTDIRKTI